jgi:hypothetical protein
MAFGSLPFNDSVRGGLIVLLIHRPDSKFGITQLRYPDDSLCSDDMPGAVVASSLRALEQREDCDRNEFDDTHYKLVSVGSKLDGFIGCTSGCEPETCERFDGVWGQCSGHGEGGKGGNNHYKFFPTRTNGMDEAGAAKNRSFPLCAGQKATPTPRHMTTPMPTTVPSAVKEKYKLPMIILGSLFGACICSYLIFYVLRKRKLQRMSSYAALQDDPTF